MDQVMFSLFWAGMQQDIKLLLLAPAVCALFRLVFILVYGPKKSPFGEWRKWFTCFRYAFWWGMDFNAYVYLYLLALVSLPAARQGLPLLRYPYCFCFPCFLRP